MVDQMRLRRLIPRPIRDRLRPLWYGIPPLRPTFIGYVRQRSATAVSGWLHDPHAPARRLQYQAVATRHGQERVLATGTADRPDPELAGLGDTAYGFLAQFPAQPPGTRVDIRPVGFHRTLPDAPGIVLGYLRERSTLHVAGWLMNSATPDEPLRYDVVCTLPGRQRVVASGIADQYDRILFALGEANPAHGFRLFFAEPLSEAERDHLEVRAHGETRPLPEDPALITTWKPVRYIAMDIVDNCNLRCPFCLFDHAPVHKTNAMTDEVFAAALRWLPYVGPEGHWMSCLHEPTMHPRLTEFITRIPDEYRHVMTYTTNLTRRMPDKYFAALADSGLSNINVSIESRDPAIYERMRKGGKFPIFMENWDRLLAAFARGKAPPPLRYIAMAYKSNYREIPELVEYLRNERNAWKIEIRDTYDVAHIPQEFRDAEFLERHEWQWLKQALSSYSPVDVALSLPPDFDQAAPAPASEPAPPPAEAKKAAWVEGLIEARILHDGQMIITTSPAGNYPNQGEELARMNVLDIADPGAFILSLRGNG